MTCCLPDETTQFLSRQNRERVEFLTGGLTTGLSELIERGERGSAGGRHR